MCSSPLRAIPFAGLVVMLVAGSAQAQSQPQRSGSAEPPPEGDVLLTPGGISDIYRPGVLAAVAKPASRRDLNGVWVLYVVGLVS